MIVDFPKSVEYGYCHCGCGMKTKIANKSNTRMGILRMSQLTISN